MPYPILDSIRYPTWIACLEAPAELPERCRSAVGPVSYLQAPRNALDTIYCISIIYTLYATIYKYLYFVYYIYLYYVLYNIIYCINAIYMVYLT